MANNFESNFTRQLAPIVTKAFETRRALSKNVNTQLLEGRFSGSDTGDTVDFKRPTDYISRRTSNGDISGTTASDIITGKSSGVIQDYFTVEVDYDEASEAIEMAQKNELVDMPMMNRIVTDFELDFARFMLKNTALVSGTTGVAVDSWGEVARAGATLEAHGVPRDDGWCYAMNPYTQVALADQQRGLGVNPEAGTANEKAIIKENFAGMKVMSCTSLASYTNGAGADRTGALSATPNATYLAHKDTMVQSLAVDGFQANLVIPAGTTLAVAGRNRLNLSTRQPVIDASGAQVSWTATTTTDVTLDGSGAGTLLVTGPAIFESGGQYNTVDSALADNDVVLLGGTAGAVIQPNLFWHKQAFSVGSVPIKKLHSTDTLAVTKDGLMLRVSKGSSIRENKQIVRIDFRPAYACLNPFFAGQGFGTA